MTKKRELTKEEADNLTLRRLRLARRHAKKAGRDWERAEKRMNSANRRLFEAIDAVEARGLSQVDPRSMD